MRIIQNISVKRELESYIDALHTTLTTAGLFNGPKYMLFGMTGMAFKFVAHKNIISPSRYMYHLEIDNWKAVDRIGIYNEIYFGNRENPTFPLYQKKAIERIKESIDHEVPSIFWDPGKSMFAVLYGYDDEDSVFFYKDRFQEDEQILLYHNLGKIDTRFWLCQVFGERIEKDIRDIYIDSLESAVYEWETYNNVPEWSNGEYASGRLAYDYVIRALEKSDFNERGTISVLYVAIKSKESIYRYLEEVIKEFPQISKAVGYYKDLNNLYIEIEKITLKIYDYNDIKIVDNSYIPKLVQYLKEAKIIEEKAVIELKHFLSEILYNKNIDYYGVNKFIE